MPVAIVSDTCHYLSPELVAENEIHQVSLYVHLPTGTQRESEIEDYAEFFRRLRASAELPTTSQPSVGDFLAVYEPLLDEGNEIVSIHLAGGMSGTVGSAEQARQTLGRRAERVHVIDSTTACGGEGLVVLAAAAAARAGGDGSAVKDRALRAREQLRMWFAIDTLEYLRRGGRIGGAQAWLGAALKIKPILMVESEITPFERVRTSQRALERLTALLAERARDGADGWMVQHIQAPAEAEALVARGRDLFGCEPVGVGGIPSSFLR